MASLTPRELELKNKLYSQYKQNKNKFVKDYGENAEKVMTGRAITLAKRMAEKENKLKIKEIIKKALKGPIDEIDSNLFLQNRKPVSDKSPITPLIHAKKENPEDVVKLDIPLLIRMLEYAREDAKTDMDLHFVVENMIELSKIDRILNMEDYESIVSPYSKIDNK